MSVTEKIGDVAVPPIEATGKGMVRGLLMGALVVGAAAAAITGAFTLGLAALAAGGIGAAIAGGAIVPALVASGAAGLLGAMGGGVFGAKWGGAFGLLGGIAKGVSNAFSSPRDRQQTQEHHHELDQMREAVVRENARNQALRQQVELAKRERASSIAQMGGNPAAKEGHVEAVTAPVQQQQPAQGMGK